MHSTQVQSLVRELALTCFNLKKKWSHVPQWRLKILSATTKTQCSQINKSKKMRVRSEGQVKWLDDAWDGEEAVGEKRMKECSRQRNSLCKDLEIRARRQNLKINIIHWGRSRVWLVVWEDRLGSHHEFRLYLKDNGEKHHQIHLLEIQLPGGKWIREDEWWFALLAPMLTVPCIHTLAMAAQWTEDTFYHLALGQAIQSVLASSRWQKQRVPFLSPGIKKPWVFPLALWYLCLCQVHGAREEDARQMEPSHPVAAAWSTASPAASQTPKRGKTVFVFMRCWNFQYAVLLWLVLEEGHTRSSVMY